MRSKSLPKQRIYIKLVLVLCVNRNVSKTLLRQFSRYFQGGKCFQPPKRPPGVEVGEGSVPIFTLSRIPRVDTGSISVENTHGGIMVKRSRG